MSADWSGPMRRALELAERGRYGASPNPMVGAVVVAAGGAVVGSGAHLRCGGPHAEVAALEEAGSAAAGATLVVTLEPCVAMPGKRTPPCVDAVLAAGIARVVVGARDPNPLVDGRGVEALRAAGVEVVEGVEDEACRALNRRFFHFVATGRPFVTLKMAMTLDGKLAARGGRSRWITSEASRREGYALREEADGLLVGVRTVLADDPRLNRHLGLNPSPHLMRVVLDSTLRTPPTAVLFASEPQDVVLFCREDAPADRRRELEHVGATVVAVGDDGHGRCDLRQALRWLGGRGVTSLLVEGGGEVHWSFLVEGLAQRVHAFVAPLVLGGHEATPAVAGPGFASPQDALRLRFVEVRRLAEDLVVTAEVVGV
ncbi:MAG TPA: bifunctional diaminohydroxyphosphoribosylaminopyrimidine deaminase/5-amino-6-(5-phosphoribosylamino)uracil reductase RibD [Thermoanaerobaculaceae bacterium]|nr:bifunctional diaminohydroxyphosphoribosylaminopyrimidine deaminase/5-amino-6-(5-phosphoribosylamino)uracil reductase RibD [Thermoanaerobaculaceae bacterium]